VSVEQNGKKTNFKNQSANKISGSKRQTINRVQKKLHHEQLHDFYGCHNYYNQVTLFYNQLDIKVIW
jgi:hypothetical protein